jgi:adenine phosphoribosyltransferase
LRAVDFADGQADAGHVPRETKSLKTNDNSMKTNKERLIKNIRNIPDFPIPGVQFKDVTTLFKDAECLQILSDLMYETYKDKGITKVVGVESRGFIMGPILATRLNTGFVPIRKPGKLPAAVIEECYAKEYGADCVQIHKDAIDEQDVVLLHDDLLATGGTMKAACNLVKKLHPKKIYVNFIIELEELKGKDIFDKDIEIESILTL